ncbi:hypothetical protein [Nocardiopsis alba]|uniref:hypothetical protein n=1 Tax=Nocardiopsis alba TaxID=53437 RepID=UPI0033D63C3F
MRDKKRWLLIACLQAAVLGFVWCIAKFEAWSEGEVSIFTKYAAVVWVIAMVCHGISFFLEPDTEDDRDIAP